jgi:transposase
MWALLKLPRFGGANTRANMRFVETKIPEQQSGMVLHRTRHLCMRQQISVINAIPAYLAEFGLSLRSAAMVLRSCSISSLIQVTDECRTLPRTCLAVLGYNCAGSTRKFWSSTG